MTNLTASATWLKLLQHQQQIKSKKILSLFNIDPARWQNFSLSAAHLFFDYSKNLCTDETINLLCQLAKDAKLTKHIEAMFNGEAINYTENRAVLHTALRDPERTPHLIVENIDVTSLIKESLAKMQHCVESIHNGSWQGYSGKPIQDIVNIGIGGSDLGPAMVVQALQPYVHQGLRCHFVSNIDSTNLSETLKNLNPETTLFLIASKTFTTQETLCNAKSAKDWLLKNAPNKTEAILRHFIAITAKPERAIEFGIATENVYPFWDWVGGRYSLWSAIGLSIAIAIGMDNFHALLNGAKAMDEHFRTAPFAKNMPVLLGLLGIWHINFFHADTQAIIPYDQYLSLLPAYLQQLEMESNGKSVSQDGNPVDYATAPVIWGSVGTNGQHAFHQLLMQGTELIPVDFILPLLSQNPLGDHHLLLVANCLAQAQALMQGRSEEEVIQELKEQGLTVEATRKLIPHKIIAGNKPTNMILMEMLTPETLGALIALYEHKVFVQGIIWRINSFDQWGVELGKKLTDKIVSALKGDKESLKLLDQATQGLVGITHFPRRFIS